LKYIVARSRNLPKFSEATLAAKPDEGISADDWIETMRWIFPER